jgi:serine/threonine-protein kinase HipA
MAAENRIILVYADWEEIGHPVLMGTLTSTHVRGKEIFSFEYSTEWLSSAHATVIV